MCLTQALAGAAAWLAQYMQLRACRLAHGTHSTPCMHACMYACRGACQSAFLHALSCQQEAAPVRGLALAGNMLMRYQPQGPEQMHTFAELKADATVCASLFIQGDVWTAAPGIRVCGCGQAAAAGRLAHGQAGIPTQAGPGAGDKTGGGGEPGYNGLVLELCLRPARVVWSSQGAMQSRGMGLLTLSNFQDSEGTPVLQGYSQCGRRLLQRSPVATIRRRGKYNRHGCHSLCARRKCPHCSTMNGEQITADRAPDACDAAARAVDAALCGAAAWPAVAWPAVAA
eukprot:365277-Chlamydomonas_euryale.AAC.15